MDKTIKSRPKGSKEIIKTDETDEMKLQNLSKMNVETEEDNLYPPELNAHLLEQIRILNAENNELRKCVHGKDIEIKELNETMKELNQRIRDIISGSGPVISSKAAGIISAKISELYKQNRHLTAEVESYKTKNSTLERKVLALDMLLQETKPVEKPCSCSLDLVNVVGADPAEVKDLTEKLSITSKKLHESKNKISELKAEVMTANKVLQQELGDRFTSIKDLQANSSGWKSRAQQIVILQNKISDLEVKLNVKNNDPESKRRETLHQAIKEIETKKKREMDATIKELETLKTENQETKKKLDGARARVRNLECDLTALRQKMQVLLDKSGHDDLLVSELRKQIKATELYYQEIINEYTHKLDKQRSETEDLKREFSNNSEKIESLRLHATNKDNIIADLKKQLRKYEECSLQSIFFSPMKTAADNEIQKLTEMITMLNHRLTQERHNLDEVEAQNRKLRAVRSKLNLTVTKLETELKGFKDKRRRSTAHIIPPAGTTLAGKESREESKDSISKGSSEAVDLSRPSMVNIQSRKSHSFINEEVSKNSCSSVNKVDADDWKNKLELAEERLKYMEDKLRILEFEKENDLRHLTGMILSSKQLFREALAVLQKEKCVCQTFTAENTE